MVQNKTKKTVAMIRKRVLSVGNNSATLLVQDTEANGELRVLRRVSVASWSSKEIQGATDIYEKLQSVHIRGLVPIHHVLLQNSFLSVVASYFPDGDAQTYLEDVLTIPLEEKVVLRWMSAIAQVIQLFHRSKLCFYGLKVGRLFVDHTTGGTAEMLVGIPLPAPVYFSQLEEGRKAGMVVDLEYPPEVVKSGTYHPTLSDVWCLGRIGIVLLTANDGHLSSRSVSLRQLIAKMMVAEPTSRFTIDEVVQQLASLAGKVVLGQPQWSAIPSPRKSTGRGETKTSANSSHASTVASVAAAAGATTPKAKASEKTTASAASPPPTSTRTRPNAGVPRPAIGVATAPPDDSESRATSSSPSCDAPLGGAAEPRRGEVRQTRRQKEMTSSALPAPMTSRECASARAGGTRPKEDSWHRRAQEQFEELQRLNASPLKQHIIAEGENDRYYTPRRVGGALETNEHRTRSAGVRQRNKSESPHPHRGSGLLDNNTRMLNEMFAERDGQWRREFPHEMVDSGGHRGDANGRRHFDVQDLQEENLRHVRLETAARQQEMRRHFTEWQRQNKQRLTDSDNLVMEKDGVVIVAPRLTPRPANEPNRRVATPPPLTALANEESDDAVEMDTPWLLPAQPSASRLQKPSSRFASPKNGAAGQRTMSRRGGTPRSSDSRNPTRNTPAAAATRKNEQLRSNHIVSNSTLGRGGEGDEEGAQRRHSGEALAVSTMGWSIDGIRSAIRGVLRNRSLYAEAMEEVNLFLHQQEDVRLSARANEIFTQRLRGLISDERMFDSAASLCSQLVALEGALRMVQEKQATHSTR